MNFGSFGWFSQVSVLSMAAPKWGRLDFRSDIDLFSDMFWVLHKIK